jgi:hypothetical protein
MFWLSYCFEFGGDAADAFAGKSNRRTAAPTGF